MKKIITPTLVAMSLVFAAGCGFGDNHRAYRPSPAMIPTVQLQPRSYSSNTDYSLHDLKIKAIDLQSLIDLPNPPEIEPFAMPPITLFEDFDTAKIRDLIERAYITVPDSSDFATSDTIGGDEHSIVDTICDPIESNPDGLHD